jgi:hypothetical protein
MVETARQFTFEEPQGARGHSRWMLVAMLKSYWLARSAARILEMPEYERHGDGCGALTSRF